MFNSIYSEQMLQYYNLRSSVLGKSARKHELCYLNRFDSYLAKYISSYGLTLPSFSSFYMTTKTSGHIYFVD